MNKIHKVIWSANLGVWVAVSELVKGKKKSSTSSQVADHSHTTKQHHSYLKKIQLASVFLALAALTPSVYAGIQIGKGDYFTGNRPNLGTFMGDDITADGDIRGKSIIANETVNSVDGNFLGTLTSKNGEFTNVTVHKDSFFEGTVNADNGIVIGRSYEDPDRTRLLQGSLTIDTVTKDGENNIYTRTQLDKNGLTLKNGPSVTLSGVDAGNAKVTNVEDGDVTQDSKQAVNGSQLYAAINDSKNLYNALAERAGGNIRVQAGENSGFKDIGLGDTLRFEAGNNTSVRVTPEGYLEYSVADEPTFTNLHVNGTTTSNSLEVTGNATVGERLFVNDTAVVNKELHVTGGDAFFGEDENGSFTHIQKDNIIVQNPKTDGSNGFYRTETADDYFGVYDVNNDAKTVSQATVTPHFLYVADKANGAEDRAQLDNSGLKFYSTDADGNLAATGPDITRDGLNAGNLKVTNVAPGAIATDSTDGINGSQLFGLGNSAATVLGEGVTFENGQLVGKDIGGTGADTIVGAIAAANKAAGTAGQGWKLNVDEGFLGSKKSANIAPGSEVNLVSGKNISAFLKEGNTVELNLNDSVQVSSLGVDEKLGVDGAIDAGGNITTDSSITAKKDITAKRNLSVEGNAIIDGGLTAFGPTALSSTLTVTGQSTFNDAIVRKNLNVNGDSIFKGNSLVNGFMRVEGDSGLFVGKSLDDPRGSAQVKPGVIVVDKVNENGGRARTEVASDYIGSYDLDANDAKTKSSVLSPNNLVLNQTNTENGEINEVSLSGQQMKMSQADAEGNPLKWTIQNPGAITNIDQTAEDGSYTFAGMSATNFVTQKVAKDGSVLAQSGVRPERIWTQSPTEAGSFEGINLTKDGLGFYNESTGEEGGPSQVRTGPFIGREGISAGEFKIADVADGEVSETSKDAINGSQLFASTNALSDRTDDLAKALAATTNSVGDLGASAANVLGDGVTFENGQLVGNDIGGTGANTIVDAIAAANKAAGTAGQGWKLNVADGDSVNIAPGSNVNFTAGKNLTVSLNEGNNVEYGLVSKPVVERLTIQSATAETDKVTQVADLDRATFHLTQYTHPQNGSKDKVVSTDISPGRFSTTDYRQNKGVELSQYGLKFFEVNPENNSTIYDGTRVTSKAILMGKDDGRPYTSISPEYFISRSNNKEGITVSHENGSDFAKIGSYLRDENGKIIERYTSSGFTNDRIYSWNQKKGVGTEIDPDRITFFEATGPEKTTYRGTVIDHSGIKIPSNDGQNYLVQNSKNLVIRSNNPEGVNKTNELGSDFNRIATFTQTEDGQINFQNLTAQTPDEFYTFDYKANEGTKLDAEGLGFYSKDADNHRISQGPSVTRTGIDAGELKVTNVADGEVSEASKDAVNGSQLFASTNALSDRTDDLAKALAATTNSVGDLGASAANVLGEGVTYQDGKLVGDNIGGTGANTITGAIQAASEAASDAAANAAKGWNVVAGDAEAQNVAPDDTVNFTAGSNLNVALNDGHNVEYGLNPNLVGLNSAQFGDENASTIVDGKGLVFAAKNEAGETVPVGPSISKDGIDAGNTKVTNLADADITADSTDAVSGHQLFTATDALAQRDQQLAQRDNDLGNSTAGVLGEGVTYQDGKLVGNDIGGTGANTITGAIQAASEAASDAAANAAKGWNVVAGDAEAQNVAPDDTVNFTAGSNLNVALNDGHNVEYGLNPNLVGLNSAQFGDDNASTIVDGKGLLFAAKNEAGETVPVGPSISKDGIDAGNTKVTNLAEADITADSKDAVSGGQLFAATDALAQRDQELAQRDNDLAAGLGDLGASTAGVLGDGVTYQDGKLVGDNIGGTGANTITGAIQAASEAASDAAANAAKGWNVVAGDAEAQNVAPDDTVNFTAGSNLNVALNDGHNVEYGLNPNLVGLNSAQFGDENASTIVDGKGLLFAAKNEAGETVPVGPSISKDGIDAGNTKVTNLAEADITADSKDAVSGGQLFAATDALAQRDQELAQRDNDLAAGLGDLGASTAGVLGDGVTYQDGKLVGDNIGGTGANTITGAIQAASEAASDAAANAAKGWNVAVGETNQNVAPDDTVNFTAGSNLNVALNDGHNVEYGLNPNLVGLNSAQFGDENASTIVDGKGLLFAAKNEAGETVPVGPSISKDGIDAGNTKVTNLADADITADSKDAVSGGQLFAATDALAQRDQELAQRDKDLANTLFDTAEGLAKRDQELAQRDDDLANALFDTANSVGVLGNTTADVLGDGVTYQDGKLVGDNIGGTGANTITGAIQAANDAAGAAGKGWNIVAGDAEAQNVAPGETVNFTAGSNLNVALNDGHNVEYGLNPNLVGLNSAQFGDENASTIIDGKGLLFAAKNEAGETVPVGPSISKDGIDAGNTKVTNLADADITADSKDAVSGGQLFAATDALAQRDQELAQRDKDLANTLFDTAEGLAKRDQELAQRDDDLANALFDTANSVGVLGNTTADVLGDGVTYQDGKLVGDNIGGTGANTITGAIQAANDAAGAAGKGWNVVAGDAEAQNVAPGETVNFTAGSNLNVALNDGHNVEYGLNPNLVGLNSAQFGDENASTIVDGKGLLFAAKNDAGETVPVGPSISKDGIDAGNTKVTNLAEADITADSKDAVSGGQLFAATDALAQRDQELAQRDKDLANTLFDTAEGLAKRDQELAQRDDDLANALFDTANSVGVLGNTTADVLGDGVTYQDGKLVGDNIGGTGANTITGAIQAANDAAGAAGKGWNVVAGDAEAQNVAPGETVNFTAGSNLNVALNDGHNVEYGLNPNLVGLNSAQFGDENASTIVDGKGLLFAAKNEAGETVPVGPSISKDGIDAGNTKVTNLADADITADSKDAVSGGQLFAATDALAQRDQELAQRDKDLANTLFDTAEGLAKRDQELAQRDDDLANALFDTANSVGVLGNTTADVLGDGITYQDGKLVGDNIGGTGANTITGAIQAANDAAGAAGKGWNVVAGDAEAQNVAPGETVNFTAGSNLNVALNDGHTVEYGLKPNVDLTEDGSVKIGEALLTGDGLRFVDAEGARAASNGRPAILKDGINAGDLKITDVADGEVSDTSKDAINGSQLFAATDALAARDQELAQRDDDLANALFDTANSVGVLGNTTADVLGDGVTYQDGKLVGDNIGGTGANTITGAIQAANDAAGAAGKGWNVVAGDAEAQNVAPGETVNFTAGSNLNVALNDGHNVEYGLNPNLVGLNSAQFGDENASTIIDGKGLLFAAKNEAGETVPVGPSISKDGIDAGNTKVTNLADADITADSKDAVSGGQLFAATDALAQRDQELAQRDKDLANTLFDTAEGLAKRDQELAQRDDDLANALFDTANSVGVLGNTTADVLGEGVTYQDGKLVGDNIGGTGANTITGAIQAANDAASAAGKGWTLEVGEGWSSKTKDIQPGDTVTFDGDGNIDVALKGNKVAIGLGDQVVFYKSLSTPPVDGAAADPNIQGGVVSTLKADYLNIDERVTIDDEIKKHSLARVDQNGVTLAHSELDAKGEPIREDNLKLAADGLRFINQDAVTEENPEGYQGPSITKEGVDAGNFKVTNVADGDVTAESKDAINGGQLFAATDALAARDQELAQRDKDLANTLFDTTEGLAKRDQELAQRDDDLANALFDTANSVGVLGNTTADVLGDGVTYQDGKLVGNNIGGTGANTITGAIQAANDAAGAAGKGWNVVAGDAEAQNVAPGETVNFTAGSNLNVALNDGHNVEYGLNPNLVGLNSAQFGDENASTIIDGKGLLFAAKDAEGNTVPVGPSISKDGIDAGNTRITNLADGEVNANSKDAINGGQLFAATDALAARDQELAQRDNDLANALFDTANSVGVLGNSTADVLGDGVTYKDGKLVGENIGGTGASTITDAIKAANDAAGTAGKGWNVAVGDTTQTVTPEQTVKFNAGNNLNVTLNDDHNVEYGLNPNLVGLNSAQFGDENASTIIDSKGLFFAAKDAEGNTVPTGPSISKDGIDAGNTVISNVGAGSVAAGSTDVVNGGQLHDFGESVADVFGQGVTMGDDGKLVGNDIGGTNASNLTDAIQEVNDKADQAAKGWNLAVDGQEPVAVTAGSTVGLTHSDGIVLTQSEGPDGRTNINIGFNGQAPAYNGDITADSITSKVVSANTLNVGQGGINVAPGASINMGGNQVHNVAPGFAPNDAVNVGQLNQLATATANETNRLENEIRKERNKARAGTAAALAAAGLVQAQQPGESVFAIGGGTFEGEGGYAAGLSSASENGKWLIKGSVAGDSRGQVGGSASVGYRWR